MPYREKNIFKRFESKIEIVTETGCWIWMASCLPNGYGQFARKYRMHLAHRISWELYRGPIPDGHEVLHMCDTKPCVNPNHLWTGTQVDNMQDCLRKGRNVIVSLPGALNGNSKITETIAREIMTSNLSTRELVKKFNIGKSQVRNIKTGVSWNHIQ